MVVASPSGGFSSLYSLVSVLSLPFSAKQNVFQYFRFACVFNREGISLTRRAVETVHCTLLGRPQPNSVGWLFCLFVFQSSLLSFTTNIILFLLYWNLLLPFTQAEMHVLSPL